MDSSGLTGVVVPTDDGDGVAATEHAISGPNDCRVQVLQALNVNDYETGWSDSDELVADKAYRAVSLLLQIRYSDVTSPPISAAVKHFLVIMTGTESVADISKGPVKLSPKQRDIVSRSAREASKQAISGEYILDQEMSRRIDIVKIVLLLRVNLPHTVLGLIEGFSLYFQHHAVNDDKEKRKSMEGVLEKVAPLIMYPSPAFKVLLDTLIPRQGPGAPREMPLDAALANIGDNHTALVEVLSRLIAIKAQAAQYRKVFEKSSLDARVQLVIAIISSASLDHSKCLTLMKSLDSTMRPQEDEILLTMVRSMQNLTEVDSVRVRQFVVATRRLLLLSSSRDVISQERLINLIMVWHLQLSFQTWKNSSCWSAVIALSGLKSIFSSCRAYTIGLPLDLSAIARLIQFILQHSASPEVMRIGIDVTMQLTNLMFVGSLSTQELSDEKLAMAATIFRQMHGLCFMDSQSDELRGRVQVLLITFMSLTEGIFNRIVIDQDRQLDNKLSALLTRSVTFSYSPCDNESELVGMSRSTLVTLRDTDRNICIGSRLRSFQYFRTVVVQPHLVEGRCFLSFHTDKDWVAKVVRKGDLTTVLLVLEAQRLTIEGGLYALVVRPGVALTDDVASKLCSFVQRHPSKSEVLNDEQYQPTLAKLSHNLRVLSSRGVKAAALLNLSLPKVSNFDARWRRFDIQNKTESAPSMVLSIEKTLDTSKVEAFSKRKRILWPQSSSTTTNPSISRDNAVPFEDLTLGPGFDSEFLVRLRQGEDVAAFLVPLCGDVAISSILRNGTLNDWISLFERLPDIVDPTRVRAILKIFLERIQNRVHSNITNGPGQRDTKFARSILCCLLKGQVSPKSLILVRNVLSLSKDDKASVQSVLSSDLESYDELDNTVKAMLVLYHPVELRGWRNVEVDQHMLQLDLIDFHGPDDEKIESLIKSLLCSAPAIGLEAGEEMVKPVEDTLKSLFDKISDNPIAVLRLLPLLLKPVQNMIQFHSSNEATRGANLELYRATIRVLRSLENTVTNHPNHVRDFLLASVSFLLAEGRSEYGIPGALGSTAIELMSLLRKTGGIASDVKRTRALAGVGSVMEKAGKQPDVVAAINRVLDMMETQ